MMATDDSVDAGLIERILGEYREMPGLALTMDQARRLWGCDAGTCRCVIDVLVARGMLRWSRDGRLIVARSAERGAAMNIWHDTPDAPRTPRRVSPTQNVELTVGTWPIGPGQSVWVAWAAVGAHGTRADGIVARSGDTTPTTAGRLTYEIDDIPAEPLNFVVVGGVMAGARRFQVTLGPFPVSAKRLTFRFHCQHPGCDARAPCCAGEAQETVSSGEPTLPTQVDHDYH